VIPSRACLVCTLILPALVAHDLYILPDSFHPDKGATLQVAFHNGDSFPQSEVAPKPIRLQEAKLVAKSGSAPVQNLRIVGKETLGNVAVPAEGSLLLAVHTVPNFIELAPDKFIDYLKEEGLTPVIEWRKQHGETEKSGRERYRKYAKSLLRSGRSDDFYRKELGFPIEIVALADPYALHPGGTLPVRILFRGKPAPDLQLEAAWSGQGESKTTIIGRTDQEGRISVPLEKAGKWRLHSLKMERCGNPAAADWESFWASLTFEIL
jgi:Domain of unknown function (DUF4198)